MEPTLPKVYRYLDYRKYLGDFCAGKKALNRGYSYRLFCRKAGINSPGYLSEVIGGRRNLSKSYLPKFAQALDLDDQERSYFETLVAFGHARTDQARQSLYELLLESAPLKVQKLRRSQLDYFSKWYHVAIREALSVHPVPGDGEELADLLRPAITPAQAKAALRLLADLGLVERDAEGRWKARHASLVSRGDENESLLYRAFRKEMILRALDALDQVPADRQNSSCITLSVSAAGMDRILGHVEEFHRRVLETVQSDAGEDRVVQVNVQVFPLTRWDGSAAKGGLADA